MMKKIMIFFLVLFLVGCNSVLIEDSETYNTYSNLYFSQPITFDSDSDEVFYINENNISYIDLRESNKKIINIAETSFLDDIPISEWIAGKPIEKYEENIYRNELIKVNNNLYFILHSIEIDASENYYLVKSDLDTKNMKKLLTLKSNANFFRIIDGNFYYSYFDEEINGFRLDIYNNKLKLTKSIEGISFFVKVDNQLLFEVIPTGYEKSNYTIIKSYNIENDEVEIISEGYNQLITANEDHYVVREGKFDINSIENEYVSSVYNDKHELIFSLPNKKIVMIQDNMIIAGNFTGNQIFSRYSMEGNLIDEIDPSDFFKRESKDGYPSIIDEVTMYGDPLRYKDNILISFSMNDSFNDVIICDYNKMVCEVIDSLESVE